MNIIVSTHDSLAPILGGGALRTLKCAENLKNRGFNVIIIAPTDGVGEIMGIKVHWLHAPRKQRSQILSSLKFNIRLLRKYLQFINQTDIFFIHNTISAATLPVLKMFFKFVFVLDLTDIHAEYLLVAKRSIVEKMFTSLLLAVEYWIIRSAERVIVETNAMKKHLLSKGVPEHKIAVVYDGADMDKMPLTKESGSGNCIIHFGSIDKQHGVEDFITAASKVALKHPEARYYIVGGGRELRNIKELAKSLNIYDKCVFTGYLPYEEARQYLSKTAIGIIARKDNLPNRIITTLKLYEYWASKTAVISSDLEGIKEICSDGRDILLFEHDNIDSLAENINRLLEDKAMTGRISEEGYRTAHKYVWDRLIPKIVDFSLAGVIRQG